MQGLTLRDGAELHGVNVKRCVRPAMNKLGHLSSSRTEIILRAGSPLLVSTPNDVDFDATGVTGLSERISHELADDHACLIHVGRASLGRTGRSPRQSTEAAR
jgi:hypothetical protein